MSKKLFTFLLVIGLLTIGVMTTFAQTGNGGNGHGGGGNGGHGGGNGIHQPANTQNGNATAQQRGQMNRNQRGSQRNMAQTGAGLFTDLPAATVSDLPQDIVDLMIDGWMDEQHALAVYDSVIAQFGEINPFSNIIQAEAQHASAWEMLFERYDITTPEVPTFDVPTFDTSADACAAAVQAEIANFELYDTMISNFEAYPDLHQVATSLSDASEFNHLPAFENCAG